MARTNELPSFLIRGILLNLLLYLAAIAYSALGRVDLLVAWMFLLSLMAGAVGVIWIIRERLSLTSWSALILALMWIASIVAHHKLLGDSSWNTNPPLHPSSLILMFLVVCVFSTKAYLRRRVKQS